MYTNIPTRTAITKISKWLKDNQEQFPDLPTKAVLKALILIMEWSFFHFGDTTWRQLKGTAMGAPPAPPYATIYFAILESILLRSFMDSLAVLQLYRRYIDDVFGIWHCRMEDNQLLWEGFQKAMNNNEYKLHWEFTALSSQVDFMDMTITLTHDNKLVTTLYEKPTNLYLYIPSHSCHPPGLLSGVVNHQGKGLHWPPAQQQQEGHHGNPVAAPGIPSQGSPIKGLPARLEGLHCQSYEPDALQASPDPTHSGPHARQHANGTG
ncbi:Reverse transcriptase (RNA-dependent DNA polymerase) [Seminavis robusta]|uniref:Reverse transcriptase (RNA-dependent DNA polymerase) n=1 Tax=Seminavis robusta TaxID=568900 RepID=A0A9N8DJC4_9STRA|nr:Reverse transcriptase (RNA-dependent DNA polymerase) [Seminavis robusta]|eukprot:Sro175_g077060.1 Reverse transcriptase (RNA-dependent DNA polymerase) (265) ;mRNA; r:53116-54044